MIDAFDLIIVGAGAVGSVVAELAARKYDMKCLIVEIRNHIAGNCYDFYHKSGLLTHKYGPHYFRTNNVELFNYLSRFTEWLPGNFIVKSYTRGELFPFPINLITLEQFYNRSFTPEEARDFLDKIREHIHEPKNAEEFVVSRVGREIYEAFYRGYNLKQWELHPRNLAPSVCGRIPIRFNKDQRYVDHKIQVTPAHGFTQLFEKMIQHPNIKIMLQTNYHEIKNYLKPKIATVYSGPVDEYFDYQFGRLPWRSLEFDFQVKQVEYFQPCVQINYPNDFTYTRTVEIKHVTGQKHHHTVISYEFPKGTGEPYYPVPSPEAESLYEKYRELVEREKTGKKVYIS